MPRDSDPTNAALRWSLLLVIYGMQLQPINFIGVDISDYQDTIVWLYITNRNR